MNAEIRFGAVAAQAALEAGRIQKAHLGRDIQIEHKGTIDLVTEVDRACEQAIVELLRKRFPKHDVVTEESDIARTGSRYVWVVDPLDGTTNFAHGYPFFCASVALTVGGELEAAAVYDPVKEELFTAERGRGAYLNGRRLNVSDKAELLQAVLVTGFPYDVHAHVESYLRLFRRFLGRARGIRRDGAAALDLCYLAAGRIDGFWEEKLHVWDVAAGALLIQEAGGRVTRFDGSPLGMHADEVLATNGHLHEIMMEIIGTPDVAAGVAEQVDARDLKS